MHIPSFKIIGICFTFQRCSSRAGMDNRTRDVVSCRLRPQLSSLAWGRNLMWRVLGVCGPHAWNRDDKWLVQCYVISAAGARVGQSHHDCRNNYHCSVILVINTLLCSVAARDICPLDHWSKPTKYNANFFMFFGQWFFLYFSLFGWIFYLGSLLTRDGYCTREIKMRIAIAKEAFNIKTSLLTNRLNI